MSNDASAAIIKGCKHDPDICPDGTQGKVYAVLVSGKGDNTLETIIFDNIQDRVAKDLQWAGIRNLNIKRFYSTNSRDSLSQYLNYDIPQNRPCDTLLFIYNGHGHQDTIDTTLGPYSYQSFKSFASKYQGKKFLVFDACESGAFSKQIVTDLPEAPAPKRTIAIGSTVGCKKGAFTAMGSSFSTSFSSNIKNKECDIVSAYIETRQPTSTVNGYGPLGSIFSTMNPKEAKLPCECECTLRG